MTARPSKLLFDIGGAKVDVAKQLMLLERSEMEDSLYLFLKHAWRFIDSSTFTEGWPLEAMAEHLQAVADGDIKRLIINIPPRCGKSSLISVAFPAWVWAQPWNGPTSGPGVQFLSASYAQQLSLRDSVKCRRLIESPWYQELWGDRFKLVSDQNTKTRFDNDKSGSRLSTSVGSALTGEGGNCIIIDDPNAAQEAYSEASIAATIDWWDTALSTRLNDPKTGAFVLIQQRLSEEDLTGHILSKDAGSWTHLCLPARYEWDRHSSTSIGWNDPRGCDEEGNSLVVIDENGNRLARDADAAGELSRREGLLLWPERMGEREISILEKQLGPDAAAGQLQQRPSPKGGGIIKDAWWQVWDANVFPEMSYVIAALDTAYTIKTSNDFSALTVWGVFTGDAASTASRYTNRDGRMTLQEEQADKFDQGTKIRLMRDFSGESFPKVMLMSAWQERAELHDLVSKVAKTCKDLKVDLLLVENKAAGHSVAQEIQRLYDREGFGVLLTDPGAQDKLARLYSVQHIFAEQMVYAPSKSWAEMVIRQVSQFPKGKHDDLVDTVSAGVSYLRKAGLLTRGPEWAESMETGMLHTGKPLAPLYEV